MPSPKLTVIFILLGIASMATQKTDVIFRVSDTNSVINITFSWPDFEEFLICLCGTTKGRKCIAEYDPSSYRIEYVQKRLLNLDTEIATKLYKCSVELSRLRCEYVEYYNGIAPLCSVDNEFYQSFKIKNSTRASTSCTALYWESYNVDIEFQNNYSNVDMFDDSCNCSLAAKRTTTTTTPVTTTTTTTTTTITSSSTATNRNIIIPVSSATDGLPVFSSAAPDSTSNTLNDDLPVGLIVGVVIGLILVAIIVTLVLLFIRRQRQKRDSSKPQNGTSQAKDTNNAITSSANNGLADTESNFPFNIPSPATYYNYLGDDNKDDLRTSYKSTTYQNANIDDIVKNDDKLTNTNYQYANLDGGKNNDVLTPLPTSSEYVNVLSKK